MKSSRLLAVNIGNSATKVGWFDWSSKQAAGSLPQPIATKRFKTGEKPAVDFGPSLPGEPCKWQIVSVHREGTRILLNWIAANRPNDAICLLGQKDLPIDI